MMGGDGLDRDICQRGTLELFLGQPWDHHPDLDALAKLAVWRSTVLGLTPGVTHVQCGARLHRTSFCKVLDKV